MAKEDIVKKDIVNELKDMQDENDQSHLEPVNVVLGRFQPFTIGHLGMAKELEKINGLPSVYIYIRSKSGKNSKFSERLTVNYMEDVVKGQDLVRDAYPMTASFIPIVIKETQRRGYNPVLIGAGEDRAKAYASMAKRMKDVSVHPDFKIQELKGRLTSATEVRQAITDDDEKKFKKLTPKQVHPYYKQLKGELEKAGAVVESLSVEDILEGFDVSIDEAERILETYGEDFFSDSLIIESILDYELNESKIKYQKGKTYQTGKGWTVYKNDDEVHFSIDVSPSAGWQTDPNYPSEMRFMDSGKRKGTYRLKSGNIEKQAKEMFDIGTKENDEYYGLTYKDYADVIRLSIDMQNYINTMNESELNELKRSFVSGTGAGSIESLENRKYELKKEVKGVRVGDYIVTLPKGTIIHNLPGGVFAKHKDLEDTFKFRNVRKDAKYGMSIRQMPDILGQIEANSKILESMEINENKIAKAFKYIKKKLGVTKVVSPSDEQFKYAQEYVKKKQKTDKVELNGIGVDTVQDVIHISYNAGPYMEVEDSIPLPVELQEGVNYTDQSGAKSALFKDTEVSNLFSPKDHKFIADAKMFMSSTAIVFTDGKRAIVMTKNKPYSIIKPLGKAPKEIANLVVKESMNEAKIKFKEEYPVYHDTYGSALDSIMRYVESSGNKIEQQEFFSAFGDAFFKPKKGKTQRKTVEIEDKNGKLVGHLHVQIYNRGTDGNTYELNMYADGKDMRRGLKENAELNEGNVQISRRNFLKMIHPLKVFIKNNFKAQEELYDLIKEFYGDHGVTVFEMLMDTHHNALIKSHTRIFEKAIMFRTGEIALEEKEKEFIPFLAKLDETKLEKFKNALNEMVSPEYEAKIDKALAMMINTNRPVVWEDFKSQMMRSEFFKKDFRPFLMMQGLNDHQIDRMVENILRVKYQHYTNYYLGTVALQYEIK